MREAGAQQGRGDTGPDQGSDTQGYTEDKRGQWGAVRHGIKVACCNMSAVASANDHCDAPKYITLGPGHKYFSWGCCNFEQQEILASFIS